MSPPIEATSADDQVVSPRGHPLALSLVALLPAVVLLVLIASIQIGNRSGAGGYDSTADWLAAKAALDGQDPGAPLVDLADRYSVSFPRIKGQTDSVHPRTPGGLVVLSPMALFASEVAYPLSVIVATIATIVLMAWVTNSFSLSRREAMLGSLLVLPSGYLYGALEFGALSPLIALMVFAYWRSFQEPHGERGGGVALGLAISLKIFPVAFLAVAVTQKRRTTLALSIGSAAVLGVIGLLWFEGASLGSYADTLRQASQQWIPFDGNLSLAGILSSAGMDTTWASVVSVTLGTLWVALSWHRDDGVDRVMTLLTIAILVTWPMVWGHYMFLAIPVLAFFWTSKGTVGRGLVVAWLVGWVILPALWLRTEVPSVLEQVSLASLQLLLIAAVHAAGSRGDGAAVDADVVDEQATTTG